MADRASFEAEDRIGLGRHIRVQWEDAQQAWVLLYPKGNVRLNATAGAILKHCLEDISVGALIATLRQEFDGADLAADVHAFLEVAHDKGWIETKPQD